MKIKIISCKNSKLWYANKINKILEVNKTTGYYGETVYEYYGKDDNGNHINGLLSPWDIIEITN